MDIFYFVSRQENVSLALHKDGKQGETASLSLSKVKKNKTHPPTSTLKAHYQHALSHLFN